MAGSDILRSSASLFAAGLALLFSMGGGTPRVQGQSLKETIRLALANDSAISAAAQGAESSQLEADAAFRGILPSLNIGSSYQYVSQTADVTLPSLPGKPAQTIALGQQNTVDLFAGVRWAPFTGFAQQATVEMKRLQALLARNNLDSTRVGVALKTVIAYRQAQAALLQIDILTSARDRAQLQIDHSAALEKEGMAQKVDVLSLTIARLGYDQKLIAARASLADALDRLKSLTDKEISVPPPPAANPEIVLPPLKEEQLDQIKALSIQRGILVQSRRLAESKLYPTLSLSAALHYGVPGVNPILNEWMLYGTAAAALSWSFNWGGDILAARAANRNLSKLGSDELSARHLIELDYASAVRDWYAMQSEAKVIEASLDLARTKMGIVKVQYEQGMASTTDFNDANLGMAQAELQYRSQLLALLFQANQIDALSGEPIDQWSVTP